VITYWAKQLIGQINKIKSKGFIMLKYNGIDVRSKNKIYLTASTIV